MGPCTCLKRNQHGGLKLVNSIYHLKVEPWPELKQWCKILSKKADTFCAHGRIIYIIIDKERYFSPATSFVFCPTQRTFFFQHIYFQIKFINYIYEKSINFSGVDEKWEERKVFRYPQWVASTTDLPTNKANERKIAWEELNTRTEFIKHKKTKPFIRCQGQNNQY